MPKEKHNAIISETNNLNSPLLVYAAGEMFSQHDLATNVYIKNAVWKQSEGKFNLVLPQSKELRNLNRKDIDAYIRNEDLRNVIKADLVLARFDGLELDSGTVVEFMLAKFLGKPVVILRSDTRRLSSIGFDEPYNLMMKNWPRTVQIHVDSLMSYINELAEEQKHLQDSDQLESIILIELEVIRKGIDEIAQKLIEGFEAAIAMKSPYPPEYQEVVYNVSRFSPGSGFDQLLTEEELVEIIIRLKANGTL